MLNKWKFSYNCFNDIMVRSDNIYILYDNADFAINGVIYKKIYIFDIFYVFRCRKETHSFFKL